ncbi:MAG: GPP34 family phosphoprotein [Candidatus Eisenbacteria bacterium]
MKKNELFLHEEVLLLALRDEKGTVPSSTCIEFPLAGAMIAELLLLERIRIDEKSKKKKLVDLVDGTPTGDDVLDEALRKIATAKRRASLKNWVMRFRRMARLKRRVAEGLCRKRILRAEEDKVLLVFKRTLYPEIDPKPEREMIERLRNAIFRDTGDVAPRTAVLVSIAKAADLLKIPFEKKKLKERKKQIERIVDGELTGKATREAIEAMQAAVMVAVILPAVISTTSSH